MNSRNLASVIWLGIVIAAALSFRDVRSMVKPIGEVLLRLAPAMLAMAACVGALIYEAQRVGLWKPALIFDTALWITTAVALFGGSIQVFQRGQSVTRLYVRILGISVLLDFYTNLYSLPFAAEMALIPWVVILAVFSASGDASEEDRTVKKLADGLLMVTGIGVIGFVTAQLITGWHDIQWALVWRTLALPFWLALGMLPFVPALGLYSAYGSVFSHIRWATKDRRRRSRSRLAVMTVLHLRGREVGAFDSMWCKRVTRAASSVRAARSVVVEFRGRGREPEEPVDDRRWSGQRELDEAELADL